MKLALARGLDLEDAIRESHAFKMRARLGFSELVPHSVNGSGSYSFCVRRP